VNVLEDTGHGSGKEHLILVVHCHYNKELRVTSLLEKLLPQSEFLLNKL
jgi:hypothetical protein